MTVSVTLLFAVEVVGGLWFNNTRGEDFGGASGVSTKSGVEFWSAMPIYGAKAGVC